VPVSVMVVAGRDRQGGRRGWCMLRVRMVPVPVPEGFPHAGGMW